MLTAILSIFLISCVLPVLHKKSASGAILLAIVTSAVLTGYFFSFFFSVIDGEEFSFNYPWIPSLHIEWNFYMDGLSLFFSLLISFFGLLITIYSASYMKGKKHAGRFFCYLFLFMGSMLGLVLSTNLITLFVFWELTSFTSFLLIGFNNTKEKARNAARQGLLTTAAGGLCLLAGMIILNIISQSMTFQELIENQEIVRQSSLVNIASILILIGVFTKSAQVPFHFWLPNAMEAPTPVSAYLHSATMVKAGVYLVFRLSPVLGDVAIWQYLLTIVGTATMTVGAVKGFYANDLKRILAYTTISALGIFFLLAGVGSKQAINAAVIYILAHALYKGTLFLIAGNVDHKYGTRIVSQLSGVAGNMPLTALAALLGCFSMAGVIPFIGYTGKEFIYESIYHSAPAYIPILILLILSMALFVAITIRIGYDLFIKNIKQTHKKIDPISWMLIIPPLILGLGGLLTELFSSFFTEPLLDIMASTIHGEHPTIGLKDGKHLNVVFILSIVTLLLGLFIYLIRERADWAGKLSIPWYLRSETLYNQSVAGLQHLATMQTKIIQNGYLRNYISMIVAFLCLLVILFIVQNKPIDVPTIETIWKSIHFLDVAILILVMVAVTVLFTATSRLTAVAGIIIMGNGIALAYTLFSAPDVGMTQFLADTLSLILLILILHKLPAYSIRDYSINKVYLVSSVFFGLSMAIVAYVMLTTEGNPVLKKYFLENAIPAGNGRNVVNVILVDFRALDTLGEITVLAITLVGIISLLKLTPENSSL